MPWIEMKLRGAKVLARCDEAGQPQAEGGRVEIRYKRSDGRAYRASLANLTPIEGAKVFPDDHCAPATAAPNAKLAKRGAKKAKGPVEAPEHPEGAIIVYADGACSGNPGPAGLGVVILDGETRRELSEYLGRATNNIAELTAILRAAEALAGREEPVCMFTDSTYSIGVLTKGWKAKANPELIAEVKRALDGIADVQLRYVPGHAGVELNEAADQLAREAVEARASSGWIVKPMGEGKG